MAPEEAGKKYFDHGRVMQLGTVHDGRPRVNSVYYVPSDDYRSVYWMSEPRRRHSVDAEQNANVAGAIVIKDTWRVIGLQFDGIAHVVDDLEEIEYMTAKYNVKYDNAAAGFVKRFQDGKSRHLFYKLVMTSLEIFDQENYGDDPVEILLD
jgi:uncharacterized protein YhbP (UPF0306 family)